MAPEPGLIAFENRDALAERLADVIETTLALAIAETGRASLAVSGGSTPAGLYRTLSARSLDWPKVTAALVDERWVSPEENGSNEKFARETLIQGKGARARLVGLWSETPAPAAAASAANERLGAVKSPFDCVVLGMGADGHTASWFPRAEGLETALSSDDFVCAVRATPSAVTGPNIDRLTLTLSAIKDARMIALVIAGDDKRKTFEEARRDGAVEDMPVRAILRARPDLWVCWAP